MKIEYIRTILLYALLSAPILTIMFHPTIALTLVLLVVGGTIGYFWGFAIGIRTGEQSSLFREFDENLSRNGMMIVPESEVLSDEEF